MIGRRQIREKVLQCVYANNFNELSINVLEQNFFNSIQSIYDLYIFQLNFLIELKNFALDKIKINKTKHLPTKEDLYPNYKFVNNFFFNALKYNSERSNYTKKNKELSWNLYKQYISKIYKDLIKSELYKKYMQTSENNKKEDFYFISNIFEEFIANNQSLHDLYEELQISWIDDFHIANTLTLKTLHFMFNNQKMNTLIQNFKSSDDKIFAKELLYYTVLNKKKYYKIIKDRTFRWELERVAVIDKIIISMAFTELQYLKTPIFVTIDESLELAKLYSTFNSKIYINGLLDKYARDCNLNQEMKPKSNKKIFKSDINILT